MMVVIGGRSEYKKYGYKLNKMLSRSSNKNNKPNKLKKATRKKKATK